MRNDVDISGEFASKIDRVFVIAAVDRGILRRMRDSKGLMGCIGDPRDYSMYPVDSMHPVLIDVLDFRFSKVDRSNRGLCS